MCLIALQFRPGTDEPLLLAANREEDRRRPATEPQRQPGKPGVICGVDLVAGGTWLGVNARRLLVAVTNRPQPLPKSGFRSRGLLCRDLLSAASALAAAEAAFAAVTSQRYAGANFLCADPQQACVVHAGPKPELIEVPPGLHLLSSFGDVNHPADARLRRVRAMFGPDPHTAEAFVPLAQSICTAGAGAAADEPPILLPIVNYHGTVSSSLITLTTNPDSTHYLHSTEVPSPDSYRDFSHLLREILREPS